MYLATKQAPLAIGGRQTLPLKDGSQPVQLRKMSGQDRGVSPGLTPCADIRVREGVFIVCLALIEAGEILLNQKGK